LVERERRIGNGDLLVEELRWEVLNIGGWSEEMDI
jgi:hypothetical protein